MPLGQGIGEMWKAVRDRIEVDGHDLTWQVTAGSFDSALAYARARFGDPVVLARTDRGRRWLRVTLTVTTDPALAASAPPLEEIAVPPSSHQEEHEKVVGREGDIPEQRADSPLPSSLEAIFAHQEELRLARQRVPAYDRHAQVADSRSG
jgi:hypothetical protein